MNTAPADHESLITGNETAEELRTLIAQVSTRCPLGKTHERCPFNMFGLLDPQVRHKLIQAMTIEACQHFFELERECRSLPDCAQNRLLRTDQ